MRPLWAAAVLVLLPLAGCVGDGDGRDTSGVVGGCAPGQLDDDGVRIVALDHDVGELTERDPWDFDATNIRTCTLEAIGWHPLRGTVDAPDLHNYLGEIDMRGDLDLGAVAVLGLEETPMVYLLDITDRAEPVVLSTISQALTYNVDVKISDDGGYLFVASQNLPMGFAEFPEDPAGLSSPWGFTIYDIRDRSSPQFVQTVVSPDDIGCHMISHEIIDGTDVVFCVGQHVRAHGLVRTPAGPWIHLGAFDYMLPDGPGPVLPGACINNLIVVGDPTGILCSGPHDMTVRKDERDGSTYMTVSHWHEGVRVVDVSSPVTDGFVTVGSWDGEGATHYAGYVHTAMMFWVGEKRYVVASPELTTAGVVPALWVLDATDLGSGKQLPLVAEWYHPQEIENPASLLMTLHQWQVAPTGPDVSPEDVRIYITWNHNGVWVLDFDDILRGDLQGAIGGFHMSRFPLDPDEEVANARLSTWDINVVDGYIYGSDRATGLWVFHYAKDALGAIARTGFA